LISKQHPGYRTFFRRKPRFLQWKPKLSGKKPPINSRFIPQREKEKEKEREKKRKKKPKRKKRKKEKDGWI
jgi:hypothetical protein